MAQPSTLEEKINEIYRILHKQESHRIRSLWYTWIKRLIIWGFVVFTILYPGVIYSMVASVLGPIIRDQVTQIFDEKKDATLGGIQDSINKIKNSLNGQKQTNY